MLVCCRLHNVNVFAITTGYMEMAESSAEGAARETLEEAGAKVEVSVRICRLTALRGGEHALSILKLMLASS